MDIDVKMDYLMALRTGCLERLLSTQSFAATLSISIDELYFYAALGSLNIQLISENLVALSPVMPTEISIKLNISVRKVRRFLVNGVAKGLLVKKPGGAFCVSDTNQWLSIASMIR